MCHIDRTVSPGDLPPIKVTVGLFSDHKVPFTGFPLNWGLWLFYTLQGRVYFHKTYNQRARFRLVDCRLQCSSLLININVMFLI